MTRISRKLVLFTALGATSLTGTLVGQPAQAGPSTMPTAVVAADQAPTCGELFMVVVPGAGRGAAGTTAGVVRTYVRSSMRWPRPQSRVVSWRNPAPTPARLRGVKKQGLDSAYFAGWRKAVESTEKALLKRVQTCPQEALIVVGYSQGAAIARLALRELRDRPRVTRRLGSLVLVGDPLASAGQRTSVVGTSADTLEGLAGRTAPLPRLLARGDAVVSWCQRTDPVCTRARISRASVRRHLSYVDHPGALPRLAGRVANAVGWLQVFPTGNNFPGYLGEPMQISLPPSHFIATHEQQYAVEEGTLPAGLAIDETTLATTLSGTPTEETQRQVTFRTWSKNIAPALHRTFWLGFRLMPRSTARPGAVRIPGSTLGDVSADGRYVVYSSGFSAQVPDDKNTNSDVFRYDRVAGTTVLLSRTPQGAPGNGASDSPRISADGRYVVFSSNAHDLDPAAAGSTTHDIFRWDATTGLNTLVSRPNGGGTSTSYADQPWISDDGSQVVFRAAAGNLVPDGQAGLVRWTSGPGTVERVALPTSGAWIGEPWVASADGRYAALAGTGSTMYVYDLQTSTPVGSCTLPFAPDRGTGELSLDGKTLAGWFGGSGSASGFTGTCDTASGTATALLGATTQPLRAADLTRDGAVTATLDGDYPQPDGFRHLDVRAWSSTGSPTSGLFRPAVSVAPHSDVYLTQLRMAMSGDGSLVAYEGQVENILPAPAPYQYSTVDIYLWDRTVSP